MNVNIPDSTKKDMRESSSFPLRILDSGNALVMSSRCNKIKFRTSSPVTIVLTLSKIEKEAT